MRNESKNKKHMIQIVLLFFMTLFLFSPVMGGESDIEHPMMKPSKYTDKGNCPNCGMMLNMWARTRHAFSNSEGDHETCSIRCLVDMAMRSGETPKNVQTALYLAPDKMIPAETATYVVGSSAPGTMTMKSKLAFASEKEAQDFVASKGGELHDYAGTFKIASDELEMARAMTDAKRKKTGKIQEPTESDTCLNCGMYPSRYPQNRSQILTADKKTLHFCSTRCLINYRAHPEQFFDNPPKETFIWVTAYPEGDFDYAGGMYYVVGSKVLGPMGLEAIPFRKKADAQGFAEKDGGKVMHFDEITPAMLQGGGHGMKMKMQNM